GAGAGRRAVLHHQATGAGDGAGAVSHPQRGGTPRWRARAGAAPRGGDPRHAAFALGSAAGRVKAPRQLAAGRAVGGRLVCGRRKPGGQSMTRLALPLTLLVLTGACHKDTEEAEANADEYFYQCGDSKAPSGLTVFATDEVYREFLDQI